MTDTTNTDATLEWLATEESDLVRQADAIDARLDVLREVRSRLLGTATQPRQTRRKRGDAPATPPAAPELGLAAQ
jgi:hypothetical protein